MSEWTGLAAGTCGTRCERDDEPMATVKLTDALRKVVAYYRVSTDKQGRSGLGLEGQVAAVEGYCASAGGTIVKAYTEVESGKRADRPELAKALAHAKRVKAVLVIAKLDRLSRNVYFLAGLMESAVEFACCDMPSANRLTLHIMAAVAEDEAKRISERTRAALGAFVENRRVPKRVREMYPEGVPAEVEELVAGKLVPPGTTPTASRAAGTSRGRTTAGRRRRPGPTRPTPTWSTSSRG